MHCAVPEEGLKLNLAPPESQDRMISRRHAKFYYEEGTWRIEDTKSTNGILVNGVKKAKATLQEGDMITFGGARQCEFDQKPRAEVCRSCY